MKIPRSRLSSLDVLILAMVKRGLATSYALLVNAKMSVGATTSALQRLESEKLLSKAPGERRSQIYSITEKGELELEKQWKKMIGSIQTPIYESTLRIMYMGWLFNDPNIMPKYASLAAERLRYQASKYELEATSIRAQYGYLWQEGETKESEYPTTALASVYRFIRCLGDAAIYRSQASALESTASEIQRLLPVKSLSARPSLKSEGY